MRLRVLAAFLAGMLGLSPACGGDSSQRGAPSSPSASPTGGEPAPATASTSGPPNDNCSAPLSSPAQFDSGTGQYAAYLTAVDVTRRALGFDVIQFLRGDDATAAYHREAPNDPEGPPNDYFIVNDNPTTREAAVDRDVRVRLVRLHEDSSADLDPGTFEELPTYLAGYRPAEERRLSANPFWLSFSDGVITAICEQYVP